MKNRRYSRSRQVIQRLEHRTLLSYSVSPDSAVLMNTSLGEVAIQLYTDMPITTANFLSYVNSGAYDGTVIHRITVANTTRTINLDSSLSNFGNTFNETNPFSIVQGGGYTDNNGTYTAIPTNAPIVNEASAAHPNSLGTIAMARMSDPNSATSQFFFNGTDNSAAFDNNLANSDYNPYAVFGTVIRGMGVVDTIDNLTAQSIGNFSDFPKTSTGADVTINSATEADTMTVNIGPDDAGGTTSVTFFDPTSKSNVTVSLAGADATLIFTGTSLLATPHGSNVVVTGSNFQLQQISSSTTNSQTTLKISGKSSSLGDIDIIGSLNSISAPDVNLTGDIDVTGGVNAIRFAGTAAAGIITLDATSVPRAAATTITIPVLSDISIQSHAAIKKLTAKVYEVDDGTARSIFTSGSLSAAITGNLQGNIQASSIPSLKAGNTTSNIQANTIGSIQLLSLTNATISSIAPYSASDLGIAKLSVQRAITSSTVKAVGNIGSINAGSLVSSVIAAGIDNTGTVASADDFQIALSAHATLGQVTLKKSRNTSYLDSEILAYQIDALNLEQLTIGGIVSGIQSHDIQSLAMDVDGKSLKLSKINSQSVLDDEIDQEHVSLGNFDIDII